MTSTVLIVDNHDVVREVVRAYVERMSGLRVIGGVARADEALEAVGSAQPDVVLVDLSLPDRSGVELIRDIRARFPSVACVVLTGHVEPLWRERAREAGAHGYVLKDDPEQLGPTIEDVLARRAQR